MGTLARAKCVHISLKRFMMNKTFHTGTKGSAGLCGVIMFHLDDVASKGLIGLAAFGLQILLVVGIAISGVGRDALIHTRCTII